MTPLKKLAGQTAIYGLSSIIGRMLNYLLVPLYTRVFVPQEYGVVTEMYAYVSFLVVIYTYGMETAFFRFSKENDTNKAIFGTSFLSIAFSSVLLSGILILFSKPVAAILDYPEHADYIIWFALVLGLDALSAIPFAQLRQENKAFRFAFYKLVNIGLNIGLNLFFLVFCPYLMKFPDSALFPFIQKVYAPEIGVGYVFISNLIASLFTMILFFPDILRTGLSFHKMLWKKMMVYAIPLVMVGMAGIVNETFDRILLKYLLPLSHEETMAQIGIYGACYKLSLLMTVFVQAFRFAAEPFFFRQSKQENAGQVYADVMKYFVIAGCLIFLVVMLYMDTVKFFIGEKYHAGLPIVPVLLLANLCLGIYYNLSVWYKLTDKTNTGAWVATGGAVVTLVLNYLWIPTMGYVGSAWATFACYSSMMVASYFIGQKYYPVNYDLKRIIGYVLLAMGFYFLSLKSSNILQNSLLLIIYCGIVFLNERKKMKSA